jgi:hypothetical protein
MPILEFLNTRTKKTVSLYRSVNDKTPIPRHLKRVWSSASPYVWKGVRNPADVDRAVPVALKQLEETMGREEMERQITYSKEELDQIWLRNPERPLKFGEKEYDDAYETPRV